MKLFMTNDPVFQRLIETRWRRPLSEAEEAELRAWLAAHPEAALEWEAEAALSHSLEQLPDVPVPSNFTARVVEEIERDARRQETAHRGRWTIWRGRRWSWGIASASLVALAGAAVVVQHQHARATERRELAASVALVSEVKSLPGPFVLTNFEAIKLLSRTAPDEQLLALLE